MSWQVVWNRKPLRAVEVLSPNKKGRSPRECFNALAKELGFNRKILDYREGKEGFKNDDLGVGFYFTHYQSWVSWLWVKEGSEEDGIFIYQYPFNENKYLCGNEWNLNESVFINCMLMTFRHFWKNRKVERGVEIEGEVDWQDFTSDSPVIEYVKGVHGFYIDVDGFLSEGQYVNSCEYKDPMRLYLNAKFFTTMVIRKGNK